MFTKRNCNLYKEKYIKKILHRILMINGYSYPERIAFSNMELSLYQAFSQHHILTDIITPTPVRGLSDDEYKKYSYMTEEELYDGWVRIHRYKLGKEKKAIIKRVFRYIKGAIKSYFNGISYKDSELIFSTSTPPLQGFLCGLIKNRLRKPFVYYLCDIFPDSLVNCGLTHQGSLMWKIGRIIENYTYKKADKIIVVSYDFKQNLLAKKVPEKKIEIVYNWIDPDLITPIPREDNTLFDDYALDRDEFYIVYAGNLGTAQGVSILVDAAAILREENINFVIFGNGTEEEDIRRRIESLQLTNIHVFPMQPPSRISEVYSLGNVSLVSCKPGFGGVGMPSKTWSIMSVAVPVLLCFDDNTELKNIIVNNKCGFYTPAGDSKALAQTILHIYKTDASAIKEIGQNSREFVVNNMSSELCTKRIIDIVKSVCERKNKNV